MQKKNYFKKKRIAECWPDAGKCFETNQEVSCHLDKNEFILREMFQYFQLKILIFLCFTEQLIVIALYDFDAINEDDLSFRKGDKLEVDEETR